MRIYKLSEMLISCRMINVREFLESVGREEIISRFGFRAQDVSRAAREGLFPSGWFPFIRDLCVERDLEVPDHLFRWSRVPDRLSNHKLVETFPQGNEVSHG